MRQFRYLFLLSFSLISISAFSQRIKPSSRIEKASDSTYILLSDIEGKYQHTKLAAEAGVTFTTSNDTLYIGATSSGGGVTSIIGGLGIKPDGIHTGDVTLTFAPDEFPNITYFDGDEELIGYDVAGNFAVVRDFQDILENTLRSSEGIVFSKNSTNLFNIDFDVSSLGGPTVGNGSVLIPFETTTGTNTSGYLNGLLINTLTSTDGSITFSNQGTTIDLSASSSGGVNSVSVGTGLDVSGTSDVTVSLDFSELNTSYYGLQGTDKLTGVSSAGTTQNTYAVDVVDNVLVAGTGISLAKSSAAGTVTISSTASGGMTSWTARTEDNTTTTVSDGSILDFEAGNGLRTQTSLGDIQYYLDGPSLTNLGAIDGDYEIWVHDGIITGARSVQNTLVDVLTSSDGSVDIGTSGTDVDLTVDFGQAWDQASVYLSATNGIDISVLNFTTYYADRRNFNISLSLPNGSTSSAIVNLPAASSTYQYHIITVTCADNSTAGTCYVTPTVYGNYTIPDGEMAVFRASQYEGTWAWFVN